MNYNISNFKALVRRSWFTKNQDDFDEFDNVYVFGIQSVSSKILTFHVMTDYGMLRSRVPLSEIYFTKPIKDIPSHFKQLWDCFSETASITRFEYLREKRCEVILRDRTKVWATYVFTIDWYDNPYSEEPSDYKCCHILKSDDGYMLGMPNNRIFWKDSNWITKNFPMDLKNIKVDTQIPSVETISDRWISEDSDCFYYDLLETNSEV
jgi:hypothetical protein